MKTKQSAGLPLLPEKTLSSSAKVTVVPYCKPDHWSTLISHHGESFACRYIQNCGHLTSLLLSSLSVKTLSRSTLSYLTVLSEAINGSPSIICLSIYPSIHIYTHTIPSTHFTIPPQFIHTVIVYQSIIHPYIHYSCSNQWPTNQRNSICNLSIENYLSSRSFLTRSALSLFSLASFSLCIPNTQWISHNHSTQPLNSNQPALPRQQPHVHSEHHSPYTHYLTATSCLQQESLVVNCAVRYRGRKMRNHTSHDCSVCVSF